jgi:hypothetical protein
MREGYEGLIVSGSMLVIAFAVIAIAKWLS